MIKHYCDFCMENTYTTTEFEPTEIKLANGDKVNIQGKFGYCLKCGEQKNIGEFEIENLENAAHVLEKSEVYKGGE